MPKKIHHLSSYVLFLTLLLVIAQTDAQRGNGQPNSKQSNSIHEADQEDLKVLAHIADLQNEIYSHINLSGSRSKIQLLEQLWDELEAIAADYTELAPGTAFLGPFSSVSLVLKQRELQKRIAQIEQQIYQR